jgi:hypothetical protein
MTNSPASIPEPPRQYSLMAGFLSYLVPGLGQIYQGRIGKGILFFVCLYGMFFYGMYLGYWSNVYLVDETAMGMQRIEILGKPLPGALAAIGHRPQFAGQFWIGIAAWPAIWQYATFDQNQVANPLLGTYQRMPPETTPAMEIRDKEKEPRIIQPALNDLQRSSDKTWDLAWVYTVIAGVLNILVIYDAFAGPAFLTAEEAEPTRIRQESQPA